MSSTRTNRSRLVAVLVATVLVAACASESPSPRATTMTPSPRATTMTPTPTALPTPTAPPTPNATPTATPAATDQPSTTPAGPAAQGAVTGRAAPPFAKLTWVPPLAADHAYPGKPTPTSLAKVLGGRWFRDDRQVARMLERQGFAVQAVGGRYFHELYEAAAYGGAPVYVTTDALYHTWHLVFDKVLRDTEQEALLPVLQDLLASAVPAARAQEKELSGTTLADAAQRTTAYYEAAAVLAGLDLGTTSARADREIDLARKAAQVTRSPVSGVADCRFPERFDGCVDYTLFLPRGHYSRSAKLKRYFAAMSLLGQESFGLGTARDAVLPGLLVTRILVADPQRLADWRALYEPTAFLVGLADDVTPLEVASVADTAAPGWRTDPERLAGIDSRATAAAILAAHPTRIDPERAGIRLMGARFTLDGYVLDQLAWPNVGTNAKRRVDVSALDVAAALGSRLARTTQLNAGEGSFKHYKRQLAAMTDLVAARKPADWAGTVYDAWLASLQPQLAPRGAAYPDYMRTRAWAAKSLQTALASFSELKHDTILYAKQGSAGEGGGMPEWEPRHWVEPDPVSFRRLAATASLLRDGLAARHLLPPADRDTLDRYIELAAWLGDVATRELAGKVVGDKGNERLGGIGSELEYLWFASSDHRAGADEQGVGGDGDAVVSDIYRSSSAYLELGTGGVDILWVIVPLGDGRFQVARGAVSSYYEFRWPTEEQRLTDEAWRAMLESASQGTAGQPVERPSWQAPFLVGARIAGEPVPHAQP